MELTPLKSAPLRRAPALAGVFRPALVGRAFGTRVRLARRARSRPGCTAAPANAEPERVRWSVAEQNRIGLQAKSQCSRNRSRSHGGIQTPPRRPQTPTKGPRALAARSPGGTGEMASDEGVSGAGLRPPMPDRPSIVEQPHARPRRPRIDGLEPACCATDRYFTVRRAGAAAHRAGAAFSGPTVRAPKDLPNQG